jgi:hypothetical protein
LHCNYLIDTTRRILWASVSYPDWSGDWTDSRRLTCSLAKCRLQNKCSSVYRCSASVQAGRI